MHRNRRIVKGSGLALVFAAGYLAASMGGVDRAGAPAMADVTTAPPREAFKAGGERSETILREIADLLKKMDGRLERIEQAATKGLVAPARK